MRLRFAGFGGQGVVLCGFIFGKAGMRDGKNTIHTQSYGSASRGGLTKSDIGIEDGEIYDLVHEEFDVLVTMSQQSYDQYREGLVSGGKLFYESDLVQPVPGVDGPMYGVQATDIAFKTFGRKIIANMLMIGFVNQIARLVSPESLAQTIRESVPKGTEDTNIAALEEGMKLAAEQLK
ncbi:MAG: 2-oxoacid:ferredoxin oxidoreductase subunit gamma [bacterium]|nr:2-oxoacid:ferredoxin oxidoreductase subunit gamma [bacterium]